MTTVALVSGLILLLAGGLFLLEIALAVAVIAARFAVWALVLLFGFASFLAVLPFRPRLALRWWAEGWRGTPARPARFA